MGKTLIETIVCDCCKTKIITREIPEVKHFENNTEYVRFGNYYLCHPCENIAMDALKSHASKNNQGEE